MKKGIVIIILLLLACFSGGCAVVPALMTSGLSFAVPQTASLAITAAGTIHKTALISADERDLDDMISDKMLTIQAQGVLLTKPGADVDATCLNGDIYVVGEYATPADRDDVIKELEELKGVKSVKGVLKQLPTSLVALIEPAIADSHAEMVIETGLIKELHIKSANVDVEVVQGEAVIMGVVKDSAEAADIVRLVESLRPKSKTPLKVTSLLAYQEEFDAGRSQYNEIFALRTQSQMLADAKPVVAPSSQDKAIVPVLQVATISKPAITTLSAYVPKERSKWQKARLDMKHRILEIAKAEKNSRAKRELITLSSRVLKDKYTSIEDRLVQTTRNTSNLTVKQHVDTILIDVAPERTQRLQTLAMN